MRIRRSTYVVTLVDIQISVHVALVRTPHGAGHAGPGLLESQNTLNIIARDFLTGDGVDNGRLDTEEGQGGTAGLGRGDTAQGSDDVGASLGLPVGLLIEMLEYRTRRKNAGERTSQM